MRYDYLTQFENKYSEGGFKRMMNDGYNCKNNHYNYIPTYTGPGHASVYTGATPENHGIIGNNWYDKDIKTFSKDGIIVMADDSEILISARNRKKVVDFLKTYIK